MPLINRVFFKHFPATVIRLQELNLGLSFETQSYITSHKKRFSPSAIVKPNIEEEYIVHLIIIIIMRHEDRASQKLVKKICYEAP